MAPSPAFLWSWSHSQRTALHLPWLAFLCSFVFLILCFGFCFWYSWPSLTQSLACAYPIINPTGELSGKCNLRSLPGDLPDRAEILPGSGERPLSICLLLLLFLICCCFPICGLKSGSQYVLGRKTTSLLKPGTVRIAASVVELMSNKFFFYLCLYTWGKYISVQKWNVFLPPGDNDKLK